MTAFPAKFWNVSCMGSWVNGYRDRYSVRSEMAFCLLEFTSAHVPTGMCRQAKTLSFPLNNVLV